MPHFQYSADGKVQRSVWNMEKRFHGDYRRAWPSFSKYFVPQLSAALTKDTDLVDIGCGNGLYLPLVAPLCGTVTGVELTPAFVTMAQRTAKEHELDNVTVVQGDGTATGFEDNSFDAALVVDTLHVHMGWGLPYAARERWLEVVARIVALARRLPDLRAFNLGGGLGARRRPEDRPLLMSDVAEDLREHLPPGVAIACEPGTLLVDRAGVLLTRVSQVEPKGDVTWVGVDAGSSAPHAA